MIDNARRHQDQAVADAVKMALLKLEAYRAGAEVLVNNYERAPWVSVDWKSVFDAASPRD